MVALFCVSHLGVCLSRTKQNVEDTQYVTLRVKTEIMTDEQRQNF